MHSGYSGTQQLSKGRHPSFEIEYNMKFKFKKSNLESDSKQWNTGGMETTEDH